MFEPMFTEDLNAVGAVMEVATSPEPLPPTPSTTTMVTPVPFDPLNALLSLPEGWTKQYVRRKGGKYCGMWDIVLRHPVHGCKIRSNVELLRFCHDNQVSIDPSVVNCNRVTPTEAEAHFYTLSVQRMIFDLGPLYRPVKNYSLCEYAFVSPHLWPSAGMTRHKKQGSGEKNALPPHLWRHQIKSEKVNQYFRNSAFNSPSKKSNQISPSKQAYTSPVKKTAVFKPVTKKAVVRISRLSDAVLGKFLQRK